MISVADLYNMFFMLNPCGEDAYPYREIVIKKDAGFDACADGFFKPTIIFSESYLENAMAGEVEGVLAHELAHVIALHQLKRTIFLIGGVCLSFFIGSILGLFPAVLTAVIVLVLYRLVLIPYQEMWADRKSVEFCGSKAGMLEYLSRKKGALIEARLKMLLAMKGFKNA